MSSTRQPRSSQRDWGLWIAGGFALVALLLIVGAYFLLEPVQDVLSMLRGRPRIPGCTEASSEDATAGPLSYRIAELRCRNGTYSMYFVLVSPKFYTPYAPVLLTVRSPIPTAVRHAGEDNYDIILKAPLADGRGHLPFTLGSFTAPKVRIFHDGRETGT